MIDLESIVKFLEEPGAKLSTVLPRLFPAALECGDYEGFLILYLWDKPLLENKEANSVQLREADSMLKLYGVNDAEIPDLHMKSIESYILLRTAGKDKICTSSVREIEESLNYFDSLMSVATVPDGLHPVDLYFKSEQAASNKMEILKTRQFFEKQYALLHSFILSKIVYYQSVLSIKERKKAMEERHKNSREVFIIHGHSEAKRRELENMLRDKFGLIPVVLSEQPDQGLTIIEKFEKFASSCSYAFALFTPDDIVVNGDKQYFQARPNVIFELGWFYANLGRARVCILDQASEQSKIFSDLQGVMRMQFRENISEKYIEIERELKSVGIID